MKSIDSLDQWNALAGELAHEGYHLSQMQYDTQHPEGFHVWFWASGKPQIEIATRSDAVHDAIVKYK